MKAGHLPNLNRHNASLALGKQASLHHHMALNTPIHTRECKEFCLLNSHPCQKTLPCRQLWPATGICRAILQSLKPKPVYLRSPEEQLMSTRTGAQLPDRQADFSSSSCCSPFPAPPQAGAGREEGSQGLAAPCTRWKMRLFVCLS